MRVRTHGSAGPLVIALHGGPGAAGAMAPVARELAAHGFRVLEPFQRRAGGEPLTVARHVADLDALVRAEGGAAPALVGHSWGAMLALAYAAEHPQRVAAIVLVGCGTFDLAARARMKAILEERTDDAVRRRFAEIEAVADPDERLALRAAAIQPIYAFDPIGADLELAACDARGHDETWADAMRLQAEGAHPRDFAAIRCPVLMLHGSHDPHPGPMIRASLLPHLPQLEYREWDRCGHDPWNERAVRESFFTTLRAWLHQNLTLGV